MSICCWALKQKSLGKAFGSWSGIVQRHSSCWWLGSTFQCSQFASRCLRRFVSFTKFFRRIADSTKLGYVFEAWQYHHQIPQITELAKEFPDLIIILNHFSGPLGIGPYENKQAEIFPQWQKDLKELSQHENVYANLVD